MVCFCGWSSGFGQERPPVPETNAVLVIDARTEWARPDGHLYLCREPAATFIPLHRILQTPEHYPFRPVSPTLPLVEGRSYWLACPIRNASDQPVPMLLDVRFPYIDAVETYWAGGGRIRALTPPTGWRVPVGDRPFAHRNMVLPLVLPARQTGVLYLHLRREAGEGGVYLRLRSPETFRRHDQYEALFWGGVGGWLLFACGLTLFLFFINGDTLYLLYCLYALCHLLALVAYEGWLTYCLPQSPVDGKVWIRTSLYLVFISNVLFIRHFFDSRNHVPRWLDIFCTWSLAAWGVLTIYYLGLGVSGQPLHPAWGHMYLFFVGINSLYIMLYIYFALQTKRNRETARLYLFAFTPLLVIVSGYILLRLELIEEFFLVGIYPYALSVVFETVVLMVGLAFRFKQYRDEREKLLLEQNQQQELAHRLVFESQMQERERLAKDLHDGIGMDLVVMKMRMETTLLEPDVSLSPAERGRLQQYAAQLGEICRDVRSVSHNMMLTDLQLHGLAPALQQLIDRLVSARPDLAIHFNHQIDELPPLHLQQPVYQIAKELLNNTVRHAGASQVEVTLTCQPDYLTLRVSDNGIGYDPSDLRPADGIGLRNIHSSVERLRGHLTIHPNRPTGVVHRIRLPMTADS